MADLRQAAESIISEAGAVAVVGRDALGISPNISDRAAIVRELTMRWQTLGLMGAIGGNPAAERLAKLAAARELVAVTFGGLQRVWWLGGRQAELEALDPALAAKTQAVFEELGALLPRLVGLEIEWGKLPEGIGLQAVKAFYGELYARTVALLNAVGGFLETVGNAVREAVGVGSVLARYWWVVLLAVLAIWYFSTRRE